MEERSFLVEVMPSGGVRIDGVRYLESDLNEAVFEYKRIGRKFNVKPF